MATISEWRTIDQQNVSLVLKEVEAMLNGGDTEVLLDFASVQRVDADALRALEQFASTAEGKSVRVTLRSVNVDVYKVLKLTRLTSKFSFVG